LELYFHVHFSVFSTSDFFMVFSLRHTHTHHFLSLLFTFLWVQLKLNQNEE